MPRQFHIRHKLHRVLAGVTKGPWRALSEAPWERAKAANTWCPAGPGEVSCAASGLWVPSRKEEAFVGQLSREHCSSIMSYVGSKHMYYVWIMHSFFGRIHVKPATMSALRYYMNGCFTRRDETIRSRSLGGNHESDFSCLFMF